MPKKYIAIACLTGILSLIASVFWYADGPIQHHIILRNTNRLLVELKTASPEELFFLYRDGSQDIFASQRSLSCINQNIEFELRDAIENCIANGRGIELFKSLRGDRSLMMGGNLFYWVDVNCFADHYLKKYGY